MGSVYLAEDLNLERNVAIKILNPHLTKDSTFTVRFRMEAKVQASLIHPGIVSLHNFFYEEDSCYMVMEYAEGITLKKLIRETGTIPIERTVEIFSQMLETVGYAHSRGVIHRDIKPGNVIIGEGDRVKIMDFGIAKILGNNELTKTGTMMGTLYYMSPEQIRAEKDIDQRTDIYSLGITLYEMLAGKLPFNSESDSNYLIMQEIVAGAVHPLYFTEHNTNIIISKIIETMIKIRKEERFPTCYQCNEQIMQLGLSNYSAQIKSGFNTTRNTDTYQHTLSFQSTKSILGNEVNDIKITNVKYFDKFCINKLSFFSDMSNIIGITISPDNKLIAVAFANGKVRFWDINGQLKGKINKAQSALIDNIRFSPNAKFLVTLEQDNYVKIWNTTEFTEVKTLYIPSDHVRAFSISPNSEYVAVGGNGKIIILELATGIILKTIDSIPGIIYKLLYSPDGNMIACSGSFGGIMVFFLNETAEKIKIDLNAVIQL